MKIQIYEGDFLDGRKAGFGILPKRVLKHIDDNNLSEPEILEALSRLLIKELYNAGMLRVVLSINNYQENFICDINQVSNVIREYKIINVSENKDAITGEVKLIVDLARIERVFHDNSERISWVNTFQTHTAERFIIPALTNLAADILNSPEHNILISLNELVKGTALFDGVRHQVYYYKPIDDKSSNIDSFILELATSNPGAPHLQTVHYHFLNGLNGYRIKISGDHLRVYQDNDVPVDTVLLDFEADTFTTTKLGRFKDGQEFRVIQGSRVAQEIMKAKGDNPLITFGSVHPHGYAVTFNLLKFSK